MYAVIKSGGKQHKVEVGDVIKVEHLDIEPGKKVTFDEVILLAKDEKATVDASSLAKVSVVGTVVDQAKADKVIVFKYKSKKGYRVKRGHSQPMTHVKIDDIKA